MTRARPRGPHVGAASWRGAAALRSLGAYFGLWTLLAVYIICLSFLFNRKELEVEQKLRMIGFPLLRSYAWALVSLLTLALVRALPLHRDASVRRWLVHLAASVPLTLLGILLTALLVPVLSTPRLPLLPRFGLLVKLNFHFSFLVYVWGVIGLHEGFQVYRRTKERERNAHQVQAKLIQAQTQTLNAQVGPHFLFNALNTIAALVHLDPALAERTLLKLGALLRVSLSLGTAQISTLNQELRFIETYLEIEKLRFGDRLSADFQIPASLLGAAVPTFLLQPLVENAIKHGVAPRAEGARVSLRACREGDRLTLEVEDDGAGARGAAPAPGPGTLQARQRLRNLYGDDQDFQVSFLPGGGALARISIPLDLDPEARQPNGVRR